MKNPYQRKKQPDIIRAALVDNATQLILEQGVELTSLQAVADATRITKGGLLHHFPTKMALLAAVYEKTILDLEVEIEDIMTKDSHPYGRFTRAYVMSSINGLRNKIPNQQIISAMLNTPGLSQIWSQWLEEKLALFDENTFELELIRLATDGVWFNAIAGISLHKLAEIERYLIEKTLTALK